MEGGIAFWREEKKVEEAEGECDASTARVGSPEEGEVDVVGEEFVGATSAEREEGGSLLLSLLLLGESELTVMQVVQPFKLLYSSLEPFHEEEFGKLLRRKEKLGCLRACVEARSLGRDEEVRLG